MSEIQPDPSRPRPMLLVAERQVPDALPAPPPPQPAAQPSRDVAYEKTWKTAAAATINVLAAVLATRLVLLVGIGGAIVLTWLALQQPDPLRLIALGTYIAGTVPALTWLAGRR